MKHPLVAIADRMQWELLERHWQQQFSDVGGPMANSGRPVTGILMLKHMDGSSGERLMTAWVAGGEPVFLTFLSCVDIRHEPPADPTSFMR